MLRKLLKYLAIFIVGFFIAYQLVLSDLNPIFSSVEYKFIDSCLTKVDVKKHNRIINLYKRIYNVKDINSALFFKKKIQDRYPSLEIISKSQFALFRVSKYTLTKPIFVIKTERNHSLEKCIALNFEMSDFLYGNRGVEMASKYYFSKAYSDLNDEELISLIVISGNPSLYNPKKVKRKAKLETKVNAYKSLIQENKNKE